MSSMNESQVLNDLCGLQVDPNSNDTADQVLLEMARSLINAPDAQRAGQIEAALWITGGAVKRVKARG